MKALLLVVALAAPTQASVTLTPTTDVGFVNVTVTASVRATEPYLTWVPAAVYKVVDGDTFDAIVEVWPKVTIRERFRLMGVDTYERKSKDPQRRALAQKGWEFTTAALTPSDLVEVRVRAFERDAFGRILCHVVYRQGDDGPWHDLGADLYAAGLAIQGWDPSRD